MAIRGVPGRRLTVRLCQHAGTNTCDTLNMNKAHRAHWLAATVLVTLIVGSIAAPHTFGWNSGLVAAADEEPENGDLPPEESSSPEETGDPDASAPIVDEEPAPDPGQDPGEGEEIDGPTGPDESSETEGSDESDASDAPATPTPNSLTLGDLFAATSASNPIDADLALTILQEYAPPGARGIEVANRTSFREPRSYSMREVRAWSRLPQLGTASSLVWMRFVGGSERTPFAVAAGRDRTDPRIGNVRVREGRAKRGNPPPYLVTVAGTDSGTGITGVEVRVGYERPLRFAADVDIEIGPFMKSTGGKVLLLARGETIQVRLIDAAGNASSWRSVRLP